MFNSLGRFSYKARWYILGVWVVLTALGAFLSPQLSSILKGGGYSAPNAESELAQTRIIQEFGSFRTEVVALFTVPGGITPTDPAFAQQIDDAVAGLRRFPGVKAVLTYLNTPDPSFVSTDGKYAIAVIGLDLPLDKAQQNVQKIKETIKPGKLEMKLSGAPVVYETITEVSQEDLERAELIVLPIALIVLLFVFRTVIAGALPLIVTMAAVLSTIGGLYAVGQTMELSIFVLNIATVLGLGIGIDYSLLIVSRYREELYKSKGDVAQAVEITVATAGRAVFFSGLTVIIGLASLFIFDLMIMRSIAVGGILVVLLGVLASITLLPAILGILGRRVNSVRLPFLKPIDSTLSVEKHGFWQRFAEWVMKRPLIIMTVVVALLLFLGSPVLHIRFASPGFDILPKEEPARQAAEILRDSFPNSSKNSDVLILVEAKSGKMTDPENVAALYDYTRKLAENPGVRGVASAVNLPLPAQSKEAYQQLLKGYAANPTALDSRLAAGLQSQIKGNIALIKLDTRYEFSSREAGDFVNSLRATKPATFNTSVTGAQAALMDFIEALYSRFPLAILLVVVVSYFILLLMFQSILLPLKAVIMTGLSLSASYGALVWIFQDGNLSGFFGFSKLGYVEATLPILLFAILYGLSMDYEVFLLSRIKEIYDETGNNTKSVALGIERTGGIITSAALLMVIVSVGFAGADIIVVKAVGTGMAIAVALDASIVRSLLVPATMKLLGDWNWYAPRFVRRYLPKLEH